MDAAKTTPIYYRTDVQIQPPAPCVILPYEWIGETGVVVYTQAAADPSARVEELIGNLADEFWQEGEDGATYGGTAVAERLRLLRQELAAAPAPSPGIAEIAKVYGAGDPPQVTDATDTTPAASDAERVAKALARISRGRERAPFFGPHSRIVLSCRFA